MKVKHGDKHRYARGGDEHQLARTWQSVDAIDTDNDGKKQNEEDNRCQRKNVLNWILHVVNNVNWSSDTDAFMEIATGIWRNYMQN